MKRCTVLTTDQAMRILFKDGGNPASYSAPLRSGADVWVLLVEHFDYSADGYAEMMASEPTLPPGDVEVLLGALGVGSLEELRDLVERGRRNRDRVPLVVV